MANFLHYEVWSRRSKQINGPSDDILRSLLASGTITSGASLSSVVTIPSGRGQSEMVLILRAYNGPVYVHVTEGAGTPAGTGTHAGSDAQPRMLINPDDGPFSALVAAGSKMAVVDAATLV